MAQGNINWQTLCLVLKVDCRSGAGLYIFVNLINVWLNKRQLDSHLCFCIPSVMIIMCVAPGKLHHTPMRQWEFKSEIPSLYYEEHSLSLRDFLNRSWGPLWISERHFENYKVTAKTGPIKTKAKITQEVRGLSKSEFWEKHVSFDLKWRDV